VDGAGETGGAGADELDIELEDFAFHLGPRW
jgi:hypothetical protein